MAAAKKEIPKEIKDKIDEMDLLMNKLVLLNVDVELWLESQGIKHGYLFTRDYRHSDGYQIIKKDKFYSDILKEINGD